MTGTFIKEDLEEVLSAQSVLFPFSLNYMHNKITFYAKTKKDKTQWLKFLREAIGYTSLYDYYDLKVIVWHFIF